MKALAGLAISVLCVTPAFAGCGHAKVIDRCLIGTWDYAGRAADLLNGLPQKPSLRVTNIRINKWQLAFRADGTFANGQMDMWASVVSRGGPGSVHVSMRTSGTWSAAGGTMNRCEGNSSTATVAMTMPGYSNTYTAPHSSGASAPLFSSYTCDVSALTIIQPREHRLPVVFRYRRSH